MLHVIKDFLAQRNIILENIDKCFIGDTWQDMHAAHSAQIHFLHATSLHNMDEINDSKSVFAQALHWRHGKELVQVWHQFFTATNWQKLIQGYTPIYGPCGVVYDLPNSLGRANEGVSVVDMCNIQFAEPHYHPDLEVYFVLQGQALVAVGGDKQMVKRGDVVIIPPFTAHYTVPDNEYVIGCINVPPYTPESYIPLKNTVAEVEFDYDDFEITVATPINDLKMKYEQMVK
jgi:quercetin dioxygenase-like cupin family protein